MLRINNLKRAAAVLLSIIMLVLSFSMTSTVNADEEEKDLYFGALEQTEIKKINTTRVKKGTFFVTGAVNGTVEYGSVSYVFNTLSEGEIYFEEFCVSNGTEVKRGDPIAKISVNVDEIGLEEQRMQLETAEKNLDEYISDTKLLMEQYRIKSETAETEEERRLGELAYQRLSDEYEAEVLKRKKKMAEDETRIDKLAEAVATEFIYADMDGTVSNLNRLRRGHQMNYYEYVCTIIDKSQIWITADDSSDLLRYNMPVKLSQTNGNKTIELTGRVVTLKSTSISHNLSARRDIIEVYGDPSGFSINKDVVVRFDRIYVPDALMVSKSAVHTDNRGSYVNLLINGYSCKKYVVVGGTNVEDSWVAFGVNEGDEIIVD